VTAHKRYVTEIKGKVGNVIFYMEAFAPVKVDKLPELLAKYKGALEFSSKGTPNFVLRYRKYGLLEKDAALMMKYTNMVLRDMEMLYD
jgi:transcription-repair coupling factor (superfamily II helicase)